MNLLIKLFVRDSDNVQDPAVRRSYGKLTGVVGIVLNVLLAAGKFLAGALTGSVAIMADAANNLSDAAGSIVALVSTRVARKPVDAEHPFGHGRMEYLGSLGVGLLILVMAFTLLKEGMEAILTPAALSVSWPVLTVLGVSIAVKAWLYFFYRRLGRATDNGTLLAASKDSLSDVLATGAVLISTGLCALFGWRIDGYIGLVVALVLGYRFSIERNAAEFSGSFQDVVNSAAANQEWKDVMFPLYASADAEIYWSGTFIRPCGTTAQNTQYGLYRYTNGSPYPERHAGIDYDCDLGDAVWAPGRGKVVYAGFLQMTGNTVVIEHGGGLKSYFFHLDSLACKQGDNVITQLDPDTVLREGDDFIIVGQNEALNRIK